MDYDEDKIRRQVIAGMKAEPWQVELEPIDFGARLGVFYRGTKGIQRVSVDTRGKNEDQIAFALMSQLLNVPEQAPKEAWPGVQTATGPSPYEGKRGKHPASCTCSKHLKADGAKAA